MFSSGTCDATKVSNRDDFRGHRCRACDECQQPVLFQSVLVSCVIFGYIDIYIVIIMKNVP